MRFIIYVHNLQQLYMRALQGKFVLHKTSNYIVPNLIIFVHCKEYNIVKTLRSILFELAIFKELIHFCCCWSVRTHIS